MTWLLVGGVLALVVYELIAAVKQHPPTISELVWRASSRTPFLPFMFGVLMGHFFAR